MKVSNVLFVAAAAAVQADNIASEVASDINSGLDIASSWVSRASTYATEGIGIASSVAGVLSSHFAPEASSLSSELKTATGADASSIRSELSKISASVSAATSAAASDVTAASTAATGAAASAGSAASSAASAAGATSTGAAPAPTAMMAMGALFGGAAVFANM